MRISKFFAVFIFLFVFNLSAWDDGAGSYDSIRARSNEHNVPFVVYVKVDWCKWCKMLDGFLEESDFDNLFRGKYAVRINPDKSAEEKAISKNLGVTGYPSMFIIKPGGSKTKISIPLGSPKEKFLESLKKQLDAVFKE
jgi:thiol:disulfide interchange protein